jgi:hypothetical protein
MARLSEKDIDNIFRNLEREELVDEETEKLIADFFMEAPIEEMEPLFEKKLAVQMLSIYEKKLSRHILLWFLIYLIGFLLISFVTAYLLSRRVAQSLVGVVYEIKWPLVIGLIILYVLVFLMSLQARKELIAYHKN